MLAKNSLFNHNKKLQAKTKKELTSNGQALLYRPGKVGRYSFTLRHRCGNPFGEEFRWDRRLSLLGGVLLQSKNFRQAVSSNKSSRAPRTWRMPLIPTVAKNPDFKDICKELGRLLNFDVHFWHPFNFIARFAECGELAKGALRERIKIF